MRPQRYLQAARLSALACIFALLASAEIIDRIEAVVAREAITSSEVAMQLRLEAMIDGKPLDLSPAKRELALNRLIERELIHNEIDVVNIFQPNEAEALRQLDTLRKSKFFSGLDFQQALRAYGVSELQLLDFLREIHRIEQFVGFRFKTGIEVYPEEVDTYYELVFTPQFRRDNRTDPPPLEAVRSQVRALLVNRRASELLDVWLKESRAETRVLILTPASALRPGEATAIP